MTCLVCSPPSQFVSLQSPLQPPHVISAMDLVPPMCRQPRVSSLVCGTWSGNSCSDGQVHSWSLVSDAQLSGTECPLVFLFLSIASFNAPTLSTGISSSSVAPLQLSPFKLVQELFIYLNEYKEKGMPQELSSFPAADLHLK